MTARPELTIAEIEIAKDWYVSELGTVEDCDDALTFLTEAIASLKSQLLLQEVGRIERDPGWRAAVTSALEWKKHAREVVYRRRAALTRADRRAAEWLRQNKADIWETALAAVATTND